MGGSSRRKGGRIERELVARLRAMGIEDAHRVPLSGSTPGYRGDVKFGDFRCEVKARGHGQGFSILERWLSDFDILFLRRDRAEPLVLLPWQTFEKLIMKASGK